MKRLPNRNLHATRLTLASFFVGIGTLGVLFRQDIALLVYGDLSRSGLVLAFSIAPLVWGASIFVYLYLRGDIDFPFLKRFVEVGISNRTYDSSIAYQVDELRLRLAELQSDIEKKLLTTDQLAPEQMEALVNGLKQQLQGVVANDIVTTIEQKYSPKIAESAQITQIRRGIDLTKARLSEEVKSLSRRNSLNLTIGAVTTGLAVGMLAYLVLGATQHTFSNIPDLLAHFIPRVSVAAFIEVFSFFFLKLYKTGLQEIKYFQNELTNVEMKSLAIEAALLPTQNKITEQVIPQLVSVDRNLSISPKGGIDDARELSAKDLTDLLEKFGKVLGSQT